MRRKIVIAVAPTGGSHTRAETPYCPTQPEEIADVVAECHKLGASMAYLHVRKSDDAPCCYPDIYRRLNDLVRERCDIIINNSSGGGMAGDMVREYAPGHWEVKFEERIKALQADPDTITIDTGTMIIPRKGREILFKTTPSQCDTLISTARANGIKPELMAFSAANVTQDITPLIAAKFDKRPYMVNLTLGFPSPSSLPYTPEIMNFVIGLIPKQDVFLTVTGMGERAFEVISHGILMGAAGIRVGVEDTLRDRDGELVSNQELVRRAVRLTHELECEPASASEARAMLGLQRSPSQG